jgi:hypothetical protein
MYGCRGNKIMHTVIQLQYFILQEHYDSVHANPIVILYITRALWEYALHLGILSYKREHNGFLINRAETTSCIVD